MNWYSENPAHLFMNLSKSEGIPVSIMEACSYGIPAVATDVGGTSELISNKTGWLINREFTIEGIVKVLEDALLNHTVRIQKSTNAREVCLSNFNSDKNYPDFVQALKELAKSKQQLESNSL